MQIKALSVQQTVHSKASLEEDKRTLLIFTRATGYRAPGERIGAVDQRESGKDRAFLAVHKMRARRAAPLQGIVHAGEVVEQQRGGVEVLESDGEPFGVIRAQSISSGHLKDELWTDQAARVVEHM